VFGISIYSLIRNWRLLLHYFYGPSINENSHIQIILSRSACYGSCPDYKVTLDDGSVEFEGLAHTAALG
jgi:hypothetical protein